MADFRRSIPVLAMVALLLGGAFTASAQGTAALQCVANAAVPPIVRQEGLTELVGDLVLNCTGGIATPFGQPVPQVNIQIFLNTAVTSDLINGSSSPWLESLLLLDEPLPGNQFPCQTASGVCSNVGTGSGVGFYGNGSTGVGTNRNVFQGQLAGSNSVLWLGVPIDAPGTAGTRVIRVTNVRANANALGVAGGNSAPTPIIMTISATGQTSVPINNPQQTVAFILKGLSFSVWNAGNSAAISSPGAFLQCVSPGFTRVATLRFTELFATAFKKRNAASNYGSPTAEGDQNGPGVIYNTESGFVNTTWVGNSARGNLANVGRAEFGTRLKAVFAGVPAGVSLWVDLCASETGDPTARICNGRALNSGGGATPDGARATTSETGAFSAVSAASGVIGGVAAVSLTSGAGTVIWEVAESDNLSLTTLSFGLYSNYTANPGSNSPALGTGTVSGSYAPTSTVGVAATGPIPRFADTGTGTNVFTILLCQTNLLFPFVTNQAGFDTGLAIASTSTDPFGTGPQSGTCTLNYYGANAPAAQTTPSITSGTVYTTLASSAAPNFQGYVIAVCKFQYGHGFAFVSDLGATKLAMGYLALVIPDPARAAVDASNGPLFGGENLGN